MEGFKYVYVFFCWESFEPEILGQWSYATIACKMLLQSGGSNNNYGQSLGLQVLIWILVTGIVRSGIPPSQAGADSMVRAWCQVIKITTEGSSVQGISLWFQELCSSALREISQWSVTHLRMWVPWCLPMSWHIVPWSKFVEGLQVNGWGRSRYIPFSKNKWLSERVHLFWGP